MALKSGSDGMRHSMTVAERGSRDSAFAIEVFYFVIAVGTVANPGQNGENNGHDIIVFVERQMPAGRPHLHHAMSCRNFAQPLDISSFLVRRVLSRTFKTMLNKSFFIAETEEKKSQQYNQ